MSALHRASASKTADLFSCGVPFRTDVKLSPDESGPWALVGMAIDDLVTSHVQGLDLTPEEAAKVRGADRGEVVDRARHLLPWLSENIDPASGWAAQMWFVWDARADRTRTTTRDAIRKGGRAPLELSAVVDLVAQTGPDEVTLYDIKSGKVAGAKPEQLATNAVAARRWYGVSSVRTAFVFAHVDGVHVLPAEFSPADLDDHAARLEAYLLEVPRAVPTPGDSCRFCRVVECGPGDEHRKRMGWRKKR